MGREIEHKFLVSGDSFKGLASDKVEICQGYLSKEPERTVRIRIAGDKAYITVKGKTLHDSRAEFEYEVPLHDGREMLEMCIPPVLCKTRYYVPFEGHRWEVDEFHGNLEGLVLAEIELESSDEPYSIPPFAGDNVTGDPRYYNSNLCANA